ncbi:MAG: hypothetical protein C0617_14160 [Desulfuromonas sp.]|uniref:GNAT family N-acetyltransferase n=1 Tax=Desulfuromonas sp. TaxID=892 RepID=UPI000CC5EF3C|nr:GNAT family N-acetyltransferase [Desulfuromonas sp.]PLX82270.1 MAG: hypothetical protein C0617_14160 [Desulfuromonas sp.]
MEIRTSKDSDWEVFLRWTRREGWRVPAQELELYRGPLAGSAFVLRADGEVRGLVTAVSHERSGWVGNLIVPAAYRGRGYGGLLFDHATDVLERRGAQGIWLTASVLGHPIYEKRGFQTIDSVVRWVRRDSTPSGGAKPTARPEALFREDARVWGESRRGLLEPLARRGRVLTCGQSVALLQEGVDFQVFGPWSSQEFCPRENRLLLAAALYSCEREELVADVLKSSPMGQLLTAAGFVAQGECRLMAKGPATPPGQRGLVALASLGSMG